MKNIKTFNQLFESSSNKKYEVIISSIIDRDMWLDFNIEASSELEAAKKSFDQLSDADISLLRTDKAEQMSFKVNGKKIDHMLHGKLLW